MLKGENGVRVQWSFQNKRMENSSLRFDVNSFMQSLPYCVYYYKLDCLHAGAKVAAQLSRHLIGTFITSSSMATFTVSLS